ncbi:hypothetical protein [Ciceribacter ferrooxidans]|uniref:Uncharacterized protein n=1 Tax=Ciceribacter ferrooxidans TaxID=2509717 RepID=A0A4Q2T052_9HYPH|nr:hypothetical protein [Ciceribacter ferrooxidans]RYC10038.1 hypothetical protein EUU22_18350 [Ciceribacter ferrooxidans]
MTRTETAPRADDWSVDDTICARTILNYLGIADDTSLDPYADRRRAKVAAFIADRVQDATDDLLQSALRDQSIANLSGIDEAMDIMRHVVEWLREAVDRQQSSATTAVEAPNSRPLVTHIRPARDGDPICYAWQVCASGEEGAVPVYEDKNGRHIVDMTDISDLRKRIASGIFDPGATEGLEGDRDLTTWQTDAVMRVLGVNIDRIAEGSDNG